MTLKRRVFAAGLAVAMAALLALPQAALAQQSAIADIQQRGAIKIGLSLFVPWSMRDKTGELIGFELDVGRKLAEDMGVDVEFVPTAWDGIIPALVAGKFDVIISGMSVTPARNLTVNFSDPYAYSATTLMANKTMTEGFSEDDYNKPEVIFAARRGGTPATLIAQRFPQAQLLLFDEDGAATQEVLNGKAHATMASLPTPALEAAKHPDVLHVPFDTNYDSAAEAFVLRKGDPDALNFFDNWIAAKWRDGFLEDRHNYWFKTVEWQDQVAE
ncbi:transporter substrate-binding domain-containing protein [Paracoccaceae bacterium Fryx2]|nr:transporter substrate-binding domain-containing protein [Paracoccaceae bacterium Fryx2]